MGDGRRTCRLEDAAAAWLEGPRRDSSRNCCSWRQSCSLCSSMAHEVLREKRVREALLQALVCTKTPYANTSLLPTCDGDAKLEAVGGVLGVALTDDDLDVLLVPVINDAVTLEDLVFDDPQFQLHLHLQQLLRHFL